MKNKILVFLVMGLLLMPIALATRDSVKILTRGYREKTIEINGKEIEGNLFVDLMYRERCDNWCKFRPILFSNNRIRFYGLKDGLRFSLEIKNIEPTDYIVFDENYFEIDGNARIIIEYLEPTDIKTNGRKIYEDVPINLYLNKNRDKLELMFLSYFIEIEDVSWK